MASLWDDIAKTIREGVDTVVGKTEEYTKIGKIKIDIINIKRNVEKNFSELGGRVYHLMVEQKKTQIAGDKEVTKIIDSVKLLEKELQDKKTELESLEQKEVQLRTTFETKQAKAVNLEAYKEQLAEMKVMFASMLEQLPRTSEVPDLLVDISRTGLINGLEFELFKPEGERSVDFYAELPITMKVTGSYHQFGEFVSGVAALPRIVTLHNISMGPLNQQTGKMTMDITAKTYRYYDDKNN